MTDRRDYPLEDGTDRTATLLTGEAASAWLACFHAVYNSDPYPPGFRYENPPLFRPAHWKVLPVAGPPDLDGDLFQDNDMDEGRRRLLANRGVPDRVVAERWPPRDMHAPLWAMLSERGVEEIAVTGARVADDAVLVGPPGVYTIAVAVADANHFMPGALTEAVTIDRSLDWALYSSIESNSVLGGEPAFVDEFIERSGGLAWLQAVHDIKYRARSNARDTFPNLYAHVGWSWPFDDDGNPL